MSMRIPVTKPFMPTRTTVDRYLDQVYKNRWLTNNGPLCRELTGRLEEYLQVDNLVLVANGTLALQIAFQALNVKGAAVTTPFTFAATSTALVSNGIRPVYSDIDRSTLNLDPEKVRERLPENPSAIVPVHVFGNGCDVEGFERIAGNRTKLIYDAAHAFGVTYSGRSILTYGDASTLSFHATKLFHTVEGGAIRFKTAESADQARELINFGLTDGGLGIGVPGTNAKMSEVHAAFGLACLDEIGTNLGGREIAWQGYKSQLEGKVRLPAQNPDSTVNFAYFPILLDSPDAVATLKAELAEAGVETRRYFFPSLDTIASFGNGPACPISRDIADTVLCLPVYSDLDVADIRMICDVVLRNSLSA